MRYLLFYVVLYLVWFFPATNAYCAPSEPPFVCVPLNLNLNDMHFFLRSKNADLEEINRMIYALDSCRPIHGRPAKFVTFAFDGYNEEQIDSLAGCIWRRNREAIIELGFFNSPINRIPRSVSLFPNVQKIEFLNCDSIRSMNYFDTDKTIFGFTFYDCNIEKLPEGIERTSPMLYLEFDMPNNANTFDVEKELSRFARRNNVLSLLINNKNLNVFPESIFKLTSLQTLVCNLGEDIKYPNRFNELVNLKYLCYSANRNNDNPYESAKQNGIIAQEKNILLFNPRDSIKSEDYYNESYFWTTFQNIGNEYGSNLKNDDVHCKPTFELHLDKKFKESVIDTSGDSALQIVSSCLENTSLVKLTLQEKHPTNERITAEVQNDYGNVLIKEVFSGDNVTLDLKSIEYKAGKGTNYFYIIVKYKGKRYTFTLFLDNK